MSAMPEVRHMTIAAVPSPTDDPVTEIEPGSLIAGRYRLDEIIGRGGMATVFRGHDERLARDVAVKVCAPCDGQLPPMREERVSSALIHNHVVSIFDGGDIPQGEPGAGCSYIVMEYVHGTTAQEIAPVPWQRAVELVRQAADGVAAAHAHGIVHCDVKPSNLLIDDQGRVLVADFGVAAEAESEVGDYVHGSPAYIAPERLHGDRPTPRVDVFGLGGVLAFLSKPGYDTNLFVDGIDPQSWDALNTSPDKPLINRAMHGMYPPGSTFKPFMALAALQLNKRSPSYTISDPGYYMLPGSSHHYRDWKAGGHGSVDMHKSIVVSCDTYYYGLAVDMGIDAIHDFMGHFGFGKKSGIDIDGERTGNLPSQEWKMKRFKQKWYAGDTVSIGIGQGYMLATPLQLAVATATLANSGTEMRPLLVRQIEQAKSGVVQPIPPEAESSLPVKPENLAIVRSAMEDVMRPGGTAARAGAGAPYSIAGKTGTAQVIGMKQGEKYVESRVAERFRDHALFIAYAPAEDPKIAVAVLVENGGHGGSTAAPIARAVFDYYLLGKLPEGAAATREGAAAGDD